jgi:uncharacterized SAM-binding protein YcdF (DUF218 family)
MTTNYLIWLFVKPSHLIFFAALAGILLWPTNIGKWLRNVTAVLVVVIALLPTGSVLVHALESRFSMPTDIGDVDGIIVLAGSEQVRLSEVYGQPQLSGAGDRLTTFLMLAHRFPTARLVHSGRREADVASDLIVGAGIDADRIQFDRASVNTCESAHNVRKAVSPGPEETWLLVTSAFHMPRSIACFRAADWEVVPYPADYRSGPSPFYFGLTSNLQTLDTAAHEWVGLLYYRITGRTGELFPGTERP